MSYGTVEQLAARVPGGIPADGEARAQAYLDDACDLIDDELGRTAPYPAGEAPRAVVRIALAVALRAWLNPTQMSSTGLGDYTEAFSHRGGIFLLEAEKAALAKHRASSDVWVQPLTRSEESTVHDGTRYFPSSDGGSRLPLLQEPN